MSLLQKTLRKHGFSLLESAVVLGVVGLILGSLWVIQASVAGSMRANVLYTQTLATVQNLRSYYSTRALPTGLIDETTNIRFTKRMAADRVWPENMCDSNCIAAAETNIADVNYDPEIKNSYGAQTYGYILGGGVIAGNLTRPRFIIEYNDMTGDTHGCITLITALSTRAAEHGLFEVVANNTSFTSFPITPAQAVTACGDLALGKTGSYSNVRLSFHIKLI